MTVKILDRDFLVLGSGVAGLYAAWQAAAHGRVLLVTDGTLASGSSYRAQGGIAAAIDPDDTPAAHVADTLAAGRGLCDPRAVELLVTEGAAAVRSLIAAGMPFDAEDDGRLKRGLEGGHSHHRILHALGVQTGRALVDFLVRRVRDLPTVDIIEQGFAHTLLRDRTGRCAGAAVLQQGTGENITIRTATTILATGGYAALFERTTNPPGAVGTGIGLARDVGARCTDLEFVQFHPTAFRAPDGSGFLISEALRGAGATLIDERGERFLAGEPGAELAPRDVVAAAIARRIEDQGRPWVGLDLRHLEPAMLERSFGFIITALAKHGIDARRDVIPVVPAAHYCIGGVATDCDGATGVPGLYAAGEVAATGVHGANRLASNSLLECLVFAGRAVAHAAGSGLARPGRIAPGPAMAIAAERAPILAARRRDLGALMTRHVGIERDHTGLEAALTAIEAVRSRPLACSDASAEYFAVQDRRIHELAAAITRAALARETSAGVHRRRDAPAADCSNPRRGPVAASPVLP